MKGVDEDGDSGQFGGDPAKGARLSRVGVDDVRALPPQEANQLGKRHEVSTWTDLAPQFREEQSIEPPFGGEIAKAALLRSLMPGYQHGLIPPGPQPMRQEDGVDCRASDIEAADDPADPNGVTHAV